MTCLSERLTDVTAAMELLTREGYRCLAPFFPQRGSYGIPDAGDPLLIGMYCDTETSGLADDADVIEFAAALFSFSANDGRIYEVLSRYSGFEQPRAPLSPEIVGLTGITDEMVAGQQFDYEAVNALAANAKLVVCHHSSFDRPKIERRFPVFASMPFACSYEDVNWRAHGYRCAKLGHLLQDACGEHSTGAHRALEDVLIGIHVLATAQLDGRPAFAHLLDSVRRPTVRVYAMQSPFSIKDTLKSRGYRSEYDNGRFYAWYRDVAKDDVRAEQEWLVSQGCVTKLRAISRRDLFTNRVGLRGEPVCR